jgi:hypothetical protein
MEGFQTHGNVKMLKACAAPWEGKVTDTKLPKKFMRE